MRKLLVAALALTLSVAPLRADYVIIDGNNQKKTVKAVNLNGLILQQTVPSDSSGNPLGTSGSPMIVGVTGTVAVTGTVGISGTVPVSISGTVPVSGTVGVTGTVAVTGTVSVSGTSAQNLTQVGGASVSLGQKTTALSIPVATPSDPDTRLTASNITVIDSGTVTNVGNNDVNYYTGTATPGSFVAQSINGRATVSATVTGTFSGSLSFEATADGVNWVVAAARQRGVAQLLASTEGAGVFDVDVAGMQQFRLRAVTLDSGTAQVAMTLSSVVGGVQVMSQIQVSQSALPSGAATDVSVNQINTTLQTMNTNRIPSCGVVPVIGPSGASLLVANVPGQLCYATAKNMGLFAGTLIAYDATAAPSTGALNTSKIRGCQPLPIDGRASLGGFGQAIPGFTSGVVLLASSSTDCTTYVDGMNVFFSATALQPAS